MDSRFYRAFEDRFRGSRELIKSRLQVYLPFINPLRCHYKHSPCVDLGCGRGEWLELLDEYGFTGQGVDIDDEMLVVCRDLGLTVHIQDAVDFLEKLPDESQVVVSGFHVVEHIPFDAVQKLFKEAKRVLKPGGMLIFETPNPENLVVGSSNFYLDPTHQRPIPPQLLAFISEHAGFNRTKILRLQESAELSKNPAPSLLGVLSGVSPDYAVIAQKEGPTELLLATNAMFETNYEGLSLETLANRYEKKIESKEDDLNSQIQRLIELIEQAHAMAGMSEERANQSEARVLQESTRAERAEERANLAESRAQQELARAERAEERGHLSVARVLQESMRAERAEERTNLAERRAQQEATRAQQAESRAQLVESTAHLELVQAAGRLHKMEQDLAEKQSRIIKFEEELTRINQVVEDKSAELNAIRKELHSVHKSNHHHWLLAEERGKEVEALRASRSWKITAPMRWMTAPFKGRSGNAAVSPAQTFIDRAIRWAMAQPRLVAFVHRCLRPFPGLRNAITRHVVRAMPEAARWKLQHTSYASVANPVLQSARATHFSDQDRKQLTIDEILQNIFAELGDETRER